MAEKKYKFIVKIWRGVSSQILGPYKTSEDRLEAARKIAEGNDTDGFFWLDTFDSNPIIGDFAAWAIDGTRA